MHSTKKLLTNTGITYARLILGTALGLFSSRWVLEALGSSNFGLFSLVGGIIIFVTMINGLLSSSATRFFALAIGRKDMDSCQTWFNTSLAIHSVIPFILILVLAPLGEFLITNFFKIDPCMVPTAIWIFRVSLITAFFNMISVPYVSMFMAKQHLGELAFWGIIQAIVNFGLAYWLTKIDGNRLIIYALFIMGTNILFTLIQAFRARLIFEECRFFWLKFINYRAAIPIFTFAMWTFFGTLGAIARVQGPAFVLNIFFGTKVNAAYGIACTVSNHSASLAGAMITALAPEITSREGAGNRESMLKLALSACKYGTFFVLIFSIPLFIEMKYILALWLKNPPLHSTFFCRMILLSLMLDKLTNGYILAVNASGKIRGYQISLGLINILTIPFAYLALTLIQKPQMVMLVIVFCCGICSAGRLFWGEYLLDMAPKFWLRQCFMPIFGMVVASSTIGLIPYFSMESSFLRFLCCALISAVISCVSAWSWLLDNSERNWVWTRVKTKLRIGQKNGVVC